MIGIYPEEVFKVALNDELESVLLYLFYCCLYSLFAWTRQDAVVNVEDIDHVFLVEDTFIDDGLFESDFFEFGAQMLVPDLSCLFLSVHNLSLVFVFKINNNTYGQKQAGRVWNKQLCAKLEKFGFKQSIIDECIFYKEDMIYVLYTDDIILAGPSKQHIQSTIKQMQETGLQLTI